MRTVVLSVALLVFNTSAFSRNVIPIGSSSNSLYYKIGGGYDFALPPVSDTTTVRIGYNANLGWGNSCSNFNPALSIVNSINELKDSAENLEQSIIASATGSLIQMPMYLLAQANPSAYNMLNNTLLSAHKKIQISTKSCEVIRDQISNGKNPYEEWGTISVGDQWKKHLSLGNEDINQIKKEIDLHSGGDGISWVQGKKDEEGILHAGGKDQPPIHVIADTTKAGFNAMLNRDLLSDDDISSGEMLRYFKNPQAAVSWITSVVGDLIIMTCKDDSCKKSQASIVGHGLLPWVISCQMDKDNCEGNIGDGLVRLVVGIDPISKDNLINVSADGIVISPEIIATIKAMDTIQREVIITKLSQEVSLQRIIDKALIAKNILTTGSQVPAIASNHPAQIVINRAIKNLDNEISSLDFGRKIRKENVSDTLSKILNDSNKKQLKIIQESPISESSQTMENGALPKTAG
jgi:integrating conjugative element protein (TIGR03755 family)